jgi:5-methylcytosine-specific restriction protein A
MLRQGLAPRGIVGSGWVIVAPFYGEHWDTGRRDPALYVRVQFDVLLDPQVDRILPRELLDSPPFHRMHWNTQASGIEIPHRILPTLEKIWADLIPQVMVQGIEDVDGDQGLWEGARQRIEVNSFERNALARQRCVAYYGPQCAICGFDFETVYGATGSGFIHVHHVVPLSDVCAEYRVDPIRDLRPVCPNCHAIIHRRQPAYDVDQVKNFLRSCT